MLNQMRPTRKPPGQTLAFLPHAREIAFIRGESVYECAARAEIDLDAPCLAGGYCGCCRLQYVEGAPLPDVWERLHISENELESGVRLACRSRPEASAIVSVPRAAAEITINGRRFGLPLAPWARSSTVLAAAGHISADTRHVLPEAALNESPRQLTLHTSGPLVRSIELGGASRRMYGISAVVSEKALSGAIMDLGTGEVLAASEATLIGSGTSAGPGGPVGHAVLRLAQTLTGTVGARLPQLADFVLIGAEEPVVLDGHLPVRGLSAERPGVCEVAVAAALGTRIPGDSSALLIGLTPVPWVLALAGAGHQLAVSDCASVGAMGFVTGGAPSAASGTSRSVSAEPYEAPAGSHLLPLAAAADAVVRLREAGWLDSRGRLRSSATSAGALPGAEPGATPYSPELNEGRSISQRQVRAFQRVKATIRQLISRASEAAGRREDEIEDVVLVGRDLGTFSIRTALASGLVPNGEGVRVRLEPDAVEAGAKLCVLSYAATLEGQRLARNMAVARVPRQPDQWPAYLYLDGGDGAPRPTPLEAALSERLRSSSTAAG